MVLFWGCRACCPDGFFCTEEDFCLVGSERDAEPDEALAFVFLDVVIAGRAFGCFAPSGAGWPKKNRAAR